MLGTATSEISNMDAQDSARRQKIKSIKQNLLAMRVPPFLREPIMEYYEREITLADSSGGDSEVKSTRAREPPSPPPGPCHDPLHARLLTDRIRPLTPSRS